MEDGTGDSGRGSLRDGQGSAELTLDRAPFPRHAKRDKHTSEHTHLPHAQHNTQSLTHSLTHSTQSTEQSAVRHVCAVGDCLCAAIAQKVEALAWQASQELSPSLLVVPPLRQHQRRQPDRAFSHVKAWASGRYENGVPLRRWYGHRRYLHCAEVLSFRRSCLLVSCSRVHGHSPLPFQLRSYRAILLVHFVFLQDLGSEVVFWFVHHCFHVARVHVHSPLPVTFLFNTSI